MNDASAGEQTRSRNSGAVAASSRGSTRDRTKAYKVGGFVLFLLCLVELSAFAAAKLLSRRGLLYVPPDLAEFDEYMNNRDPELGWPGKRALETGQYDARGSRIVPAFPNPKGKACVAVFGDSFTFGDEVAAGDSYPNVLASRLGCRVDNFGVSGYGTDQATLRYELLEPEAPIVVLGHMSENIIRNVNQNRGFMASNTFGLKPRFLLRGDELELLPLPSLTKDQYASLENDAANVLPHDYFAPGGPSGLANLRFPYTLSVLGATRHYRFLARLRGEPSYAEFYRSDHASGALRTTAAIIERFVTTARARGQKPLVLIIPDVKDLEWLRDHGELTYQSLVDLLVARKLPFVSATEPLNAYLGDRDPCDIYFSCGGSHFRPEGYRELAKVVERSLRERGLFSTEPSSSSP